MQSVEIRPFQRADREQLTALVNAHIAAVIPGISVSVNTVMSQLEREPGEAIVDPWVVERKALVAVERDAVVGGALLHRFDSDDRVSESYRDAADIRWLIYAPASAPAGEALIAACFEVMDGWKASKQYADGSLPALATYGVPDAWPHVRDLYSRSGFVPREGSEIILVALVEELPGATAPPVEGLVLERTVGACGTRFSAVLNGDPLGMIEVDDRSDGGARSRNPGWSDIGNLHVRENDRRKGIGTWLLGAAAEWLRLGSYERLVAYASPEQADELGFLTRHGFRELVRTQRGWQRS